jgi:DNA-binding PadR family transcriptional regulator
MQISQSLTASNYDVKILKVIFDNKKIGILETLEKSAEYLRSISEKTRQSHELCLYHLSFLEKAGFVSKLDTGYRKYYLLSEKGKEALKLRRNSFKQ